MPLVKFQVIWSLRYEINGICLNSTEFNASKLTETLISLWFSHEKATLVKMTNFRSKFDHWGKFIDIVVY